MRRFLPVLYIAVSVIIVLLLSAYAFLVFRVPDYQGNVLTTEVQSEVTIYRDSAGMPHIVAQSDSDAYVGLGYAMAQDRLFQMDLLRRASTGTLSEVLGPSTLRTDILFRTITAPTPASKIYAKMPEEVRAAMQSFSKGVNLAMERESLPIEFLLLGYDPEPWTPVDSIGAFYIMSWDLSPAFSHEILYSLIKERLSAQAAGQLFPEYVRRGPDILTGMQASALDTELRTALEAHATYERLMGTEDAGASNNWVIGPDKSATGTAVVANDMHLGHGIPGIWYQAHIMSPELNVTGFLLPGVPFVVVGGNQHTARGFTNVMLDDMDFYLEKLDPENPDRVLYRGAYREIEKIQTEIKIKGETPYSHTIRITPHGPIVTDIHPLTRNPDSEVSRLAGKEPQTGNEEKNEAPGASLVGPNQAIAIRWVLYDHHETAVALYLANRAKSIDDIEDSLKYFKIPAQNWVYADSKGNIGYTAAAGIPIRRGFSGMEILRGWDGSQEWSGYVPTGAQPSLRNPKEGWIASANNRHSENYPYTISNYYAAPDRYLRIKQLLESTDGLDIKDHQRIHLDVLNYQARILMPYIRQALNEPLELTGDASMDRYLEMSRNQLLDWNLQNDRESKASVIYHYLIVAMVQDLYEPLLGEELFEYYRSNRYSLFNSFRNILASPNHPFYSAGIATATDEQQADDSNGGETNPAPERNRREFVRNAFLRGMKALRKKHGNSANPDWGEIHQLEYRHPFGRNSSLMGFFFNRGPYPIDGSWTTVAPAGFPIKHLDELDFRVSHGASERMIFDVGHPDSSMTTLPAGISGQFMSPHYDDQIPNYIEGKYRPSPLSLEAVKQAARYKLQLSPK
ncbi:MAG: penicillin acylase family protein [Leptospiraceae bacterium]|nr:penicillin acylase family protein [Leptospiraceae bacterium]